jgi:hypothetical protein
MAGRLVKSAELFARAADGTIVRILEFTEMNLDTPPQSRTTPRTTPGRKSYRTGRGGRVNRTGPTEFEIVKTGVRVFLEPSESS